MAFCYCHFISCVMQDFCWCFTLRPQYTRIQLLESWNTSGAVRLETSGRASFSRSEFPVLWDLKSSEDQNNQDLWASLRRYNLFSSWASIHGRKCRKSRADQQLEAREWKLRLVGSPSEQGPGQQSSFCSETGAVHCRRAQQSQPALPALSLRELQCENWFKAQGLSFPRQKRCGGFVLHLHSSLSAPVCLG